MTINLPLFQMHRSTKTSGVFSSDFVAANQDVADYLEGGEVTTICTGGTGSAIFLGCFFRQKLNSRVLLLVRLQTDNQTLRAGKQYVGWRWKLLRNG